MTRRGFLQTTVLGAVVGPAIPAWAAAATAAADSFPFNPASEVILAPSEPRLWPEYRRRLMAWREAARRSLGYSDRLYRQPEFAWAACCFTCGFVMMWDERFYDRRRGRYRVKALLEEARRDFGGYDAVVLWHAYPRIGVDERNQFDYYRDLPGGLAGLSEVVDDFHRHQTRVFIDYNPWDTGTRREGRDDLEVLAELVGAIRADGIFLDTMNRGGAAFRQRLDAVRPGVVLEGEIALPLESVHDHHLSWAQWFRDSEAPGVLRNKWFERRHLQHQIKRWDQDHASELHMAWMNGSGMMVWENVFGSWLGWCPRDQAWLRTLHAIQRRYADLFCGEGWTPLVPTAQTGVFASRWEGRGLRLWTLINRTDEARHGPWVEVILAPGEALFDLVGGRRVKPSTVGDLPARGLGCLIAGTPAALGQDFALFLRRQQGLAQRASHDCIPLRRVTHQRRFKRTPAYLHALQGMVEIPAVKLTLRTEMRNRECGFFESTPPPNHRLAQSYQHETLTFHRPMVLARFAIDATLVTNAQYAAFLDATGWRPRQPEHFLRHWEGGTIPWGKADHPVVYLNLEDARAYAQWAGKRLPTEEEWQYAAQGADGRRYPWGNSWEPNRCNAGQTRGTTAVRAFPEGRSPFGCYDMCGNVWQWTESERSDGVTRFCIIRGGSFFKAEGSNWYLDGGPQPVDYAAKFLRIWPGLDRCATIGFRCAVDLV